MQQIVQRRSSIDSPSYALSNRGKLSGLPASRNGSRFPAYHRTHSWGLACGLFVFLQSVEAGLWMTRIIPRSRSHGVVHRDITSGSLAM